MPSLFRNFTIALSSFLLISGQVLAQPKADFLTPFLNYMFGESHGFVAHYHTKPAKIFSNSAQWGNDGFGIIAKGKKVDIYSSNVISQQYATYYLLEQYFHCNYFSAPDIGYISPLSLSQSEPGIIANPLKEALIPSIQDIAKPECFSDSIWVLSRLALRNIQQKGLPSIKTEQIPAFKYREILYGEARRGHFAMWNGLTNASSDDPAERHPGWGLWVHTFHKLLNPDMYFDSHPEFFAYRNGVYLKDQLCLSNPEVLEIVAANLSKEMAILPGAKYWSVSQMDNYQYCECAHCARIDKEEGSHSGSIIRFVNALAARFPDKVISTLAYQYSRKAPSLTKPLPNVNIMLCSIECDRAQPMKGGDFEKDLADWSSMTKNILIWDYVINFHHFLMPFPNWQTLGPNLQTFHDFGVEMIFEQGYNSPSSEFQPLRNWLLAKLMWNPDADPDSLRDVFLRGYYGPAAAIIKRYINLQTERLRASKLTLTIYEPPITHESGYLSPKSLPEYQNLIDRADFNCAGNALFRHRVEMVRQQIRYTMLEIAKYSQNPIPPLFIEESAPNAGPNEALPLKTNRFYIELLNSLLGTATRFGPLLVREVSLNPAEYAEQTIAFWSYANVSHKACGSRLMYINPPDKAYLAGAGPDITPMTWVTNQPLVDGKRGWYVYQRSWQGWWGRDAELLLDLGRLDTVNSVKVNFLENNQSWIVGPASLEVQLGIQEPALNSRQIDLEGLSHVFITSRCETPNPRLGEQLSPGFYTLECRFEKPVVARYMHVKVKNPGLLPKWRGIDANGWLFIDEIEVN